jgi:DNA-binding MarR family transcriptional regulator
MTHEPTPDDAQIESIQRGLETLLRLRANRRWYVQCVADTGVSLSHASFQLLRLLARSAPQPIGRIAERAGVDRSAITRFVERLERDGYVTREIFRHDRRLVVLTVTDAGIDAYQRVARALDDRLAVTLSRWTDDDVAELARLLTLFVESTSTVSEALTPRTD